MRHKQISWEHTSACVYVMCQLPSMTSKAPQLSSEKHCCQDTNTLTLHCSEDCTLQLPTQTLRQCRLVRLQRTMYYSYQQNRFNTAFIRTDVGHCIMICGCSFCVPGFCLPSSTSKVEQQVCHSACLLTMPERPGKVNLMQLAHTICESNVARFGDCSLPTHYVSAVLQKLCEVRLTDRRIWNWRQGWSFCCSTWPLCSCSLLPISSCSCGEPCSSCIRL